jgi:integrase
MPLKKQTAPWNKGLTVGQKTPLTYREVCKIRDYLLKAGKKRDLALLSCAFDTMLRASDLLNLKVSDVQNRNGDIRAEFPIRQKKTKAGTLVALSPHSQ